jgi:CRP-like cAMP-binding protein
MAHERGRNHLLSSLSEADFTLIKSRLEPVELGHRMSLEERNRPIERICFPESGIASVVAIGGPHQVEAGIIGREGMTGIAVVLGDDRSVNATFIQVAGGGLWLEADVLRKAMQKSGTMRQLFLRFVRIHDANVSHGARQWPGQGRGTVGTLAADGA